MNYLINFKLISLTLYLLKGVSALNPPGGCYANIGILPITSPNFNSSVWTCSGIDPYSVFWSGQNFLYSSDFSTNVSTCGNSCATQWYGNELLMGALYFPTNSTCQCWEIGFLSLQIEPATQSNENATFIDFFDIGGAGPTSSLDWGIFTCPAGSTSYVEPGVVGSCAQVSVFPAEPALAELGMTGGCADICSQDYGAQWILTDDSDNCNCYGDLAGLRYYWNWSSPYIVVDLYDFTTTATPSPSTTSKSSAISTLKSVVKSTSSSSAKVTSKSSSKTSSKSSVKSSSTQNTKATTTKSSTRTSTTTSLKTTQSSKKSSTSTSKPSSKSSSKSSSATSTRSTTAKSSTHSTSSTHTTSSHKTTATV